MREGRPTKRTPELVARIAEAIAIGLTDEGQQYVEYSKRVRRYL